MSPRAYSLVARPTAVLVLLLLLQCHLDYCSAGSLDQYVGIEYKLSSSKNYEEILKAAGVDWFKMKAALVVNPVIKLKKEGDAFLLKSESTYKTTEIKFMLGEEFDEETFDGRKVKSVITQEGNKLIQIHNGDKTTKIIWEFSPEQVKMVMTLDNITATRIYKRI